MVSFFKSLLADESGATAIEYGLIAALIAVALVGGVTALGDGLEGIFGDIAARLDTEGQAITTTQ